MKIRADLIIPLPQESFRTKILGFVTLQGNSLSNREIEGYQDDLIIITLCMSLEFMDTISGSFIPTWTNFSEPCNGWTKRLSKKISINIDCFPISWPTSKEKIRSPFDCIELHQPPLIHSI